METGRFFPDNTLDNTIAASTASNETICKQDSLQPIKNKRLAVAIHILLLLLPLLLTIMG